jgi:transposase
MTREEAAYLVYHEPERAIDLLVALSEAVEKLEARVAELERKIAELTKDSFNSSKPPSSDGPAAKARPRPPIKSKKRRPGGQPGHKGKNREILPAEHVDEVIEVFPTVCEGCGEPVGTDTGDCIVVGEPERRQVTEIPPIQPHVTEYRLHSLQCHCGRITKAPAPPVAQSAFGPRIQGIAAYLTACHRVSRRGLQDIFSTIFGVSICLGSVCNHLEEVSRTVAAGCEKIKDSLPQQPVLNVDESGWKTKGVSRWLWVFVTPVLAYFHIAQSRGSKVLKEILGESFSGVLCSDMYSAYKKYHKGLRQYCWAHIIRNIRGLKHMCRSPDAVRFSKWMLAETGRMFGVWNAFLQDRIDRETLVRKTVPIRARMAHCLRQYMQSKDREVAKTAKCLLKTWDGLFTFLQLEGVEPTNNSAERGIRPAVQWRKNCYGNQSAEGELLTSRLLTVTRTCILQGRNPLNFIVDSILAFRAGTTPPSLLPVTL